jgi:hypothetical protein
VVHGIARTDEPSLPIRRSVRIIIDVFIVAVTLLVHAFDNGRQRSGRNGEAFESKIERPEAVWHPLADGRGWSAGTFRRTGHGRRDAGVVGRVSTLIRHGKRAGGRFR